MMLLGDCSRFGLFESLSGKAMWCQEHTGVSQRPLVPFLTETFCGFVYTARHAQGEGGSFKLCLFDTLTGEEMFHESVWEFGRSEPAQPKVIASGNYLLGCSMHEEPLKGNGLLCLKVNPDSKTCKVRRPGTKLEYLLLAKTISGGKALDEINDYVFPTYEMYAIRIYITSLDFLGAAPHGVILCQNKVTYMEHKAWYYNGKTVFSVDLEKILHMYEPANLFSGVHFPLDHNIFKTFTTIRYMLLNR